MQECDTASVTFDITSPSNERIKWLVRLRDRKHRDSEGVFVVEGRRLYQRALDAGFSPVVTFVSDPGAQTVGEAVAVSPEALHRASYRSRSQGLIAVFEQMDTELDDIELGQCPLILLVENLEKPGNLGAMCRTAAAVRATAVVSVGDTVDPWNPNALRASTGAIFSLPVVASSWNEVEPWLADHGIKVAATSIDGDHTLWETDLSGPLAVVIGAEDEGISERARSIAGMLVAIPQADVGVDSLNASAAAAIFLFEVARQRHVSERNNPQPT